MNKLHENQKHAQVLVRKQGTEVPVWRGNNLSYLAFPNLEKTGIVSQAFTTRFGGASGTEPGKEYLSSLNLSFTRGDDPAHVRENFRRVANELGTTPDRFVFTDQTHTANVRIVTEADAGKGLTRPRDYKDIDGLITNVPNLVLSVFVADCVPVALVDPVHRAIGLVHSGWRGTVGKISAKAILLMGKEYGTKPQDLVCAIGPSICRDCYEVSEDVAQAFAEAFPGREKDILQAGRPGHDQLDLWAANRIILEESGVQLENISVTGVCTCCNPDILFSHRASHGRRGNLGAFLMLRGEL